MIEFARSHVIGRASGHSAVKAAAYRSGTKQHDERIGVTADYSHRAAGVAYSEILLPAGAPQSLLDRTTLWNAVEAAEDGSTRRSTAQLAKDHIIALPRELSLDQQIDMAREFALKEFVTMGVGVDLNVHLHSDGNPHAHLMVTTRTISEKGLGAKARHLNGSFYGGKRLPEAEQLRHKWADFQNIWCAERDIDLFVTNNNGEWAPEKHRGPTEHIRPENREITIPTPDQLSTQRSEAIIADFTGLINRVAKSKPLFTKKDLLGELLKHVSNPADFTSTQDKLEAFLSDVQSRPSHESVLAIGAVENGDMYYTTHRVIDEEMKLLAVTTDLLEPSAKHSRVTDEKRESVLQNESPLSDGQRDAVKYVTSSSRLSVVVGLDGAAKSTTLKAAGDAWRSAGYKVRGTALDSIAAEALEERAAIKSSSLHGLLDKLDGGKDRLDRNDVIVVGESDQINTGPMLRIAAFVRKAGAKLVLVGDSDPQQSVQAGGALRVVVSQSGFCDITTESGQQTLGVSVHQDSVKSFAARYGVDIVSLASKGGLDRSNISNVVNNAELTKAEFLMMREEAAASDFKGLVSRITKYKAVFSEHDVYRELSKNKSGSDYAQSKRAMDLYLRESRSANSRSDVLSVGQSKKGLVYYTGLKTIKDELLLQRLSVEMFGKDREHGRVTDHSREQIMKRDYDFLSDEQRVAVKHVTSSDRLSVVVGLAGAGKSTMLKAAGDAWRAAGYNVRGAALAGIAAEGLEESAAIKSSTIHSLLHKLDSGRDKLGRNDVLVVDEAGMLDTELMLRMTKAVYKARAKLVLVGDPDQLQSIQAGGPLQAMLTQGGYTEISTVRRQLDEDDRSATLDLARGRIGSAYNSYNKRGFVSTAESIDKAVDNIVVDAVSDLQEGASSVVLAHSNKFVKQINSQVRSELMRRGVLKESARFDIKTDKDLSVGVGDDIKLLSDDKRLGVTKGAIVKVVDASDNLLTVRVAAGKTIDVDAGFYKDVSVIKNPGIDDSERHKFTASHVVDIGVGVGDRIMFRKNDESLGVKNGSLGKVLSIEDTGMKVELDSGSVIAVNVKEYNNFDHGYAMTVHKSQGVTVDRARALMTPGWDRHISYVAMSRHKHSLHLYKSESFQNPVKSMEKSRHQENALLFAEKNGIDASGIVRERLDRAKSKSSPEASPTIPRGRGL